MPKPRKTTRKNVTSTCERCRDKKIKCSGHLGPKPCNSCKKLNISADKCIFQPPKRRGPKKVVKNEVIKVGKNDSDDPPESFTDNNEFDAYLQFDDQNFFSSQATETMPPTQDYMFSTQDNSMHPTQDNIVFDLTTKYINLAAVTPYHLLPPSQVPPRREALEVTNSVTSANELAKQCPIFYRFQFQRNKRDQLDQRNRRDQLDKRNRRDQLDQRNRRDQLDQRNRRDQLYQRNKRDQLGQRNKRDQLDQRNIAWISFLGGLLNEF
ncbi:11469_t:CDS:2 [Gigaspora margarita]|uniref:11469_t:CDS:1 n=1 Tax=Gigaspora margarita TaxID=4874 RepID=A0ABN7V1V5_GIGMA|nr:11469_t:CDS:2 [Gigaspora margarita]